MGNEAFFITKNGTKIPIPEAQSNLTFDQTAHFIGSSQSLKGTSLK
jgi:hypothetical protein